MGQPERISVEVPAEMAEALREAVEWGDYASTDEAVREALEGWRQARSSPDLGDEELRRLVDEALASGEPVDGNEAFDRIQSRLDALIVERHGPGA